MCGKRAVEHDAALLVAVVAELDQRAHEAAALRAAHHDRLGVRDQHRIVVAGIVLRRGLEKRAEVARGGKAQAEHQRVLGAVGELVETADLESRRVADLGVVHADRAALRAGAERPFGIGDRHPRRLFLGAHRQRRNEAVGERRLVVGAHRRIGRGGERREPAARQVERRGRRGRHQFAAHDAGDRRSVGVAGGRDRHGDAVVAGRRRRAASRTRSWCSPAAA